MELKEHMTRGEMEALYDEWYPNARKTKKSVGMMATMLGYEKVRHCVNYKMELHYLKGKKLEEYRLQLGIKRKLSGMMGKNKRGASKTPAPHGKQMSTENLI